MNRYIFYPGCSMQRSARPYLDSLMTIRHDLGMTLDEIEDWNCCGATEYTSVARLPAQALVGRNLALAAQQANGSHTVVAGCSACFLNLAKTDNYMRQDDTLNQQVNEALAAGGLTYQPGSLAIRHLLDVLVKDIGLEKIGRQVKKPLTGLRVAPYYGCMVVRPDPDGRFRNPEYPQSLDKLLTTLGAEVVDYPLKTHCCGGHMTQISPPVAYELIRRLIHAADEKQADVIAALCPMCQLNLDAFQHDTNRHFKTNYHMPVLYFTQLMGLAFGHNEESLGLGKEFVDIRPALARIGAKEPKGDTRKRKKRRRKNDPSLPIPKMVESEEVTA